MFRRISLVQFGKKNLRGPRPPAARWPPAKEVANASVHREFGSPCRIDGFPSEGVICPRSSRIGRRSSRSRSSWFHKRRRQDGVANPTRQEGRGLPLDEVVANAWAGVQVGGRNRNSGRFRSHVCHVDGGIGTCQVSRTGASGGRSHQAHEHFHREVKKRVYAFQEDVKMAQVAQEKLAKEEVLLREGEGRLQALQQEEANGMDCQEVPPTVPCNFAQEFAQLRACVFELQTERDNLRVKLQNSGDREDRECNQPRTLASPVLDLVQLKRNTINRTVVMGGQLPGGGPSSASVRMETLIENTDSSLRSGSGFNKLSS